MQAEHGATQHKGSARARELINEMGCCPPDQYCTVKEILIRLQREPRTLLQVRCIEKFKYERSEQAQRDIGWQEAFELWIAEGRADAFAQLFNEDARFADLYHAVMAAPQRERSGDQKQTC